MFVAATIIAVAADIGTKVWASTVLPGHPITLGPVTLRLVHNRGMAFGVGAYVPAWALIALTAALTAAIAVAAWRGQLNSPVGAGLMLGGAAANVGDRLTAGSVVDFIDIGRWPVFNLADVVLLGGIALVVVVHRHPDDSTTGEDDAGDPSR